MSKANVTDDRFAIVVKDSPIERIRKRILSVSLPSSPIPLKFPEEVPPSVLFIDDLAQFIGLMVFTRVKGTDKCTAFAQNFAKLAASITKEVKKESIWLAVEENISNGRKIFKLCKFSPEFSKCRRAILEGITQTGLDRMRSFLSAMSRAVSCVFYVYDNTIWASGMGLLNSDKLPSHLKFLQNRIKPKDGVVVSLLGGSSALQRRKDYLSMYRLYIAFIDKIAFAVQYYNGQVESRESYAQAWDLLSLTLYMCILRERLYGGWLSKTWLGIFGMAAAFSSLANMYYAKWRRGPKKYVDQSDSKM